MSHNDQITVQDAQPVQIPSGDMSFAELEYIKQQATATVTVLEADASQLGDAGNEAKVAGEIGMEIAGGGMLKLASTVCEIMGDRVDAGSTHLSSPVKGKTDGIVSGFGQTMDQMIQNMTPGEQSANSQIARKIIRGEEVVMSANVATSSLRGQGASVGTWDVPTAKVAGGGGVDYARRLTFDKINANQKALDAMPGAYARHDAMMYQTKQMAPGLGMTPTLRPSQMREMAESRAEDNNLFRYRKDGDLWSESGEA